MKIFSKEQIYEGDRLTAIKQNIESTDLMERAGIQIFNWLHMRMQGAQVPIHVFCGIGNNGGDGLVISRHLITHGYNVFTYIVNYSDKRSKDFLINYDLIKQTTKNWPTLLNSQDDLPTIGVDDIIIDAVFGIGLNRPADTWVKNIFQHFKTSKAFTLSVDIPSGLYTDRMPEDEDGVVFANHTLSFQAPKLVFFLPDTAKYSMSWEILDIGIDPEFLYTSTTVAELIGKLEVLPIYKPRNKFSHKGNFGHALIIGGSYGKMGAAILATKAALSSGVGLVTTYAPKCGYQILQITIPEAMVLSSTDENIISNIEYDFNPTSIGIGMGMGTDNKTVIAFKTFLKNYKGALVIDADGLNILSNNKTLIKSLPEQTILTPHPKELERLIGSWNNDFEKLNKAMTFSKKHNCIVVIKGAHTITVYLDKLYINSTGNPGLSTAGTGDVLTGIITGLLSQKYSPLEAAIFGVYLHGRSADIAVEDYGYQSLIASYVIDNLGESYIDLFKQPEQPPKEEEN
jgi:hydroxyethylthiazole kinase-like uncharacterized protein yjeF